MSRFFLKKDRFFCCVHLHYGCIFIGVSGLLIAIVLSVYVGMVLYPINFERALIAIVFLALFILGRLFLLGSVGFRVCWLAIVSFIFTALSTIVAFVLLVAIISEAAALVITFAVLFVILEIYYLYVIISYWYLCHNCCKEDG